MGVSPPSNSYKPKRKREGKKKKKRERETMGFPYLVVPINKKHKNRNYKDVSKKQTIKSGQLFGEQMSHTYPIDRLPTFQILNVK